MASGHYAFRSMVSGKVTADHMLQGSTHMFLVTGQTQTFSGDKTFSDDVNVGGDLSVTGTMSFSTTTEFPNGIRVLSGEGGSAEWNNGDVPAALFVDQDTNGSETSPADSGRGITIWGFNPIMSYVERPGTYHMDTFLNGRYFHIQPFLTTNSMSSATQDPGAITRGDVSLLEIGDQVAMFRGINSSMAQESMDVQIIRKDSAETSMLSFRSDDDATDYYAISLNTSNNLQFYNNSGTLMQFDSNGVQFEEAQTTFSTGASTCTLLFENTIGAGWYKIIEDGSSLIFRGNVFSETDALTLSRLGGATFGSTLTAAGAGTFESTLTVEGTGTFESTTTFEDTLTVSKAASAVIHLDTTGTNYAELEWNSVSDAFILSVYDGSTSRTAMQVESSGEVSFPQPVTMTLGPRADPTDTADSTSATDSIDLGAASCGVLDLYFEATTQHTYTITTTACTANSIVMLTFQEAVSTSTVRQIACSSTSADTFVVTTWSSSGSSWMKVAFVVWNTTAAVTTATWNNS